MTPPLSSQDSFEVKWCLGYLNNMSMTSIWAGRLHRLPTQECCVLTKPGACISSRRQRKQRLTWLITWEYWQTLVTFKELMMEKFHRRNLHNFLPILHGSVQGVGSTPLCCGQYNTKAKDLYTGAVNMCDSFHKQILGKPTIRGVPCISGEDRTMILSILKFKTQ